MRIEITINNTSEIKIFSSFLAHHPFTHINITEKHPQEWLIPHVHAFLQPICLHISAKHHSRNETIGYIQSAIKNGINSFLIVSGIPRRTYDSIAMLQDITKAKIKASFSIAYTPFAANQATERERLLQKIDSSIISEIYLQIGDNLEKILTEIAWLRTQTNARIIGSLLIPTPHIRQKFAHTQWQGLELSNQYISDQSTAELITTNVLELYKTHADDILLEMFPFDKRDFEEYGAKYV